MFSLSPALAAVKPFRSCRASVEQLRALLQARCFGLIFEDALGLRRCLAELLEHALVADETRGEVHEVEQLLDLGLERVTCGRLAHTD